MSRLKELRNSLVKRMCIYKNQLREKELDQIRFPNIDYINNVEIAYYKGLVQASEVTLEQIEEMIKLEDLQDQYMLELERKTQLENEPF